MSPWLVHFPDATAPQVVMDFSGRDPELGQLVIAGWVVDRKQAPAPEASSEYAIEVWVKPIAA